MTRRQIVPWWLYWLGIAFIVGCVGTAIHAQVAPEEDPLVECFDEPPICDYGRKLVCYCADDFVDNCKWFCVADSEAF